MAMFSWVVWSLCAVSTLCQLQYFQWNVCEDVETVVCPKECSCNSWRSDNEIKTYDRFTVNCSAIQFETFKNLPISIPANTTDLLVYNYHVGTRYSDWNRLSFWKSCQYKKNHKPPSPIRLVLRRCEIANAYFIKVIDRFFHGLHHIDLSENTLTEVNSFCFHNFQNLRTISLAKNFITHLPRLYFSSKQLRVINISHNMLLTVKRLCTFDLCSVIEVLDFSRNHLKNLLWDDISKLSSLKVLDLRDNPWHCSCEMRGILKLKRSLLTGTRARCRLPGKLTGTLLKDLDSASFSHCNIVDITEKYIEPLVHDFPRIILSCFIICVIYYLFFIHKRSGPGIITVRQIKFDINATLDKFGKVYRGSLLSDGQEAAIKKHPKIEVCQELRHCLHLNSNARPHPNIIRYLCVEDDTDFTYLALELCEGDLMTAITKQINGFNPIADPQDFISQLTSGICYLHENGIQHRDIKPQNILWKKTGTGIKSIKLIISDFDLSQFNEEQSQHNVKCGTKGWCPPELWNSGPRSYAVDIFPLGCVFYFILTRGLHPFGEITNLAECQDNINSPTHNASLAELYEHHDEHHASMAEDLIRGMICHNARDRITACKIMKHPYAWTKKEMQNFLCIIGRYLDGKDDPNILDFKEKLEENSHIVFDGKWLDKLDTKVRSSLKRYKDEGNDKICCLLTTVYNHTKHFRKISEALRKIYMGHEFGVVEYYIRLFPKLITYTYDVLEKSKIENISD